MRAIRRKLIALALTAVLLAAWCAPCAAAQSGGADDLAACFSRSSFSEDVRLAELSLQAAQSSNDARSLVGFLKGFGFEDVEVNSYYGLEPLENSSAVAVGRRTVRVSGGERTVLAVIPRSFDYQSEWAGNFDVGDGAFHRGFIEARDEILRFVGQYVVKHGVSGSVKVWTAGHSRGGALAGLTAAFLADGGDAYYDSLRVEPEDVYCYAFASPRYVRTGALRSEELSVAGPRGGVYAADTPGAAYVSAAVGTVDPAGSDFRGIHHYAAEDDPIALLPPASWSFERCGVEKTLAGAAIRPMTLDLVTLSPAPDTQGAALNANTFLKQRLAGLTHAVPTSEAYVGGGYQDALRALGGAIGMIGAESGVDLFKDSALIRPLLLSYLAYAAERLTEEGRASNETEAAAAALAGLVTFVTGEPLDVKTATVDDLVRVAAVYMAENGRAERNKNGAVTDFTGTTKLSSLMIDKFAELLLEVLSAGAEDIAAARMLVYSYVTSCAYGSGSRVSAAESRQKLYALIAPVLSEKPALAGLLEPASGSLLYGSRSASLAAAFAVQALTEGTGTTSLADAADASLRAWLAAPGGGQKAALQGLSEYVPQLRRLASYALLYSEGEMFDTASSVKNACTLIGSAELLIAGHYSEMYLARVKESMHQTAEPDDPDKTPTVRFADTKADAWYADDLAYVVTRGLMRGVSDTSFAPDGVMTRAMVVTTIYRLAGSPRAAASTFDDVAPGAWYADAVGWACATGVTNGVSPRAFDPDAPITREQLAAFFCRYAAWKGRDTAQKAALARFADAGEVSAWAADAVAWAVQVGLLNGVSADRLAPRRTATRIQCAAVLHRFCTLAEAE